MTHYFKEKLLFGLSSFASSGFSVAVYGAGSFTVQAGSLYSTTLSIFEI